MNFNPTAYTSIFAGYANGGTNWYNYAFDPGIVDYPAGLWFRGEGNSGHYLDVNERWFPMRPTPGTAGFVSAVMVKEGTGAGQARVAGDGSAAGPISFSNLQNGPNWWGPWSAGFGTFTAPTSTTLTIAAVGVTDAAPDVDVSTAFWLVIDRALSADELTDAYAYVTETMAGFLT